ncbi:hypothetical protein N7454_011140 [Penicillium verhagenii]|nr:hypothetical protein N7454_011140 [Penicillium verhagenii]
MDETRWRGSNLTSVPALIGPDARIVGVKENQINTSWRFGIIIDPSTMTPTFILGFIGAAVVLQIIRLAVNSWQHARRARALGCGPAPRLPCKDPIGISTLKESMAADKTKTIPQLSTRRCQMMSEQENRFVSTFIMRNLGQDVTFTIDPKNVQAVLATQFKDFELGTPVAETCTPSSEPEFQLELEETHVQKAMQAMPVAANKWTAATDIQTIFFRLTMDSATEFLFGESVESQLLALQGLERPNDNFAAYFDKSQWVCTQRARFERLSFLAETKEARHSDKQVHAFVDKIVAAALKNTENEKKVPDEEKAQYVFLDALAATTRDPIELRSQLLNILLAGRDTTASLLSWTVLSLARNPEIFRKLRETIIETFGTYNNPQNMTFAALKSCQYLQYCMNESLRLYPVVPFNRRCATRDTTIPRGGGPDGESPFIFARAKEFKPERFASRKAGWEYLPFNGGPRICIGQQFALTEAGYVLVRLLQRFDQIEDVNSDQPIRYGLTLTMCPADLLTVRMHEADDV